MNGIGGIHISLLSMNSVIQTGDHITRSYVTLANCPYNMPTTKLFAYISFALQTVCIQGVAASFLRSHMDLNCLQRLLTNSLQKLPLMGKVLISQLLTLDPRQPFIACSSSIPANEVMYTRLKVMLSKGDEVLAVSFTNRYVELSGSWNNVLISDIVLLSC